MATDEVLVVLLMVFAVIGAVISIIIGIWVLDRSRRHTPAYALGSAMQDSWAALQAKRIRSGQAAPMPTTVDEVEDLALTSMATKGLDPRELEKLEEQKKKLKVVADETVSTTPTQPPV